MNFINKITNWGDSHEMKWMDVLRFLFGSYILFRGLAFPANHQEIFTLINNRKITLLAFGLIYYTILTHFAGGMMIAFGLQVRLVACTIFPIYLGSVLLVNSGLSFFAEFSQPYWTSLLTLGLTVFFMIFGSGKISMDQNLKIHPGKSKWEKSVGVEL
jgi:putative oxidoreductase